MLEHAELTEAIIGAAIEVHRELGPGFLESIYEEALSVELEKRQIPYVRQLPVPVHYNGTQVGEHRLDLLVADELVVELKAIKAVEDVHFAVVRSYLRATNHRHGLLLNFSGTQVEMRRVIAGG
jgi:GxxExxY protein